MELPDPEAAEYLAQHQSRDLGADVLAAARTHYNGTAGGDHQPASTDSHATREERMTPVEESAAKEEAPTEKQQLSEEKQQQGYPWYTQYPPPDFPHANLSVVNHTIHTDLKKALATAAAEDRRKAEEAALADRARAASAARVGQQTTAEAAHQDLVAQARKRASIWAADTLVGPGDGGELPPGTYIHRAAGGGDQQTPAKAAREQLYQLRSQAKVWMSMQEVSLIESFLRPTDVMLEFGTGYSTVWFAQFVKELYSIEHNATWFDEIKATISEARKNVHLQLAPVAKGYKGWGGGFEEGTVEQFRHYVKAVDNFKVVSFDRVLIDGRARATAAEYVMRYLHANSLVFLHDYQARFFYHGAAAEFYDKVAETYEGQSLVVLRPKPKALKAAARAAVASLATAQ